MGALSIINSGYEHNNILQHTMVSAFTVHVLPAGKLWSLYAHLTPLPSQIITFMALFIDATSPLVPVTHAPTNHCQIAKHVNSIQSQPSIPTRDVSRRTGRRVRQRTSKVKSEGRCRVTGVVMTTRTCHATSFAPALFRFNSRNHLPARCT